MSGVRGWQVLHLKAGPPMVQRVPREGGGGVQYDRTVMLQNMFFGGNFSGMLTKQTGCSMGWGSADWLACINHPGPPKVLGTPCLGPVLLVTSLFIVSLDG